MKVKKSKVDNKISILVDEGYPRKQAVAIALAMEQKGKLQQGGQIPESNAATIKEKEEDINIERLKRGIAQVESAGGVLMKNPESSATGLYGQLFNQIKNFPELQGVSRDEFAKNLDLQDKIFEKRFYEGFEQTQTSSLQRDANELYDEYSKQLPENKMPTKEEIAVLSNFLGRQGTRFYLGYVLRDGRSLEEVFPDKYGPGAGQSNKTPEQYLALYNKTVGPAPILSSIGLFGVYPEVKI